MSTSMPFPLQLKRQFARPIDPDIVFVFNSNMQDYLSSGLGYAGMIVTCLESEGSVFVLNNDRNQWLNISSIGVRIVMVGGFSGYIEAHEHNLGENIQADFFTVTDNNLSPINIFFKILPGGRIYWSSNVDISNGCVIIK